MIIIAQGNIELTQTCEMYAIRNHVRIIYDGGSFDVLFVDDKNAEAALRLIKEEIKRQSSSCRCEVVIDIDEIRNIVEKGK
nr:MAG TPA: hypothetical protein [Caudoviricetes sp.]